MSDIRSSLNQFLRKLASPIKPSNPLRQAAGRLWTKILERTGTGVSVPIAGMQIRMLNQYRQIGDGYELDTLRIWKALVKPGDVVWDVGANIGVYTVISGKLVGNTGEVQAWEPTPASCSVANGHIALNGAQNWCQLNQAAVGEVDGSSVQFGLVSSESTDPTNRIGASSGKLIEVPVVTLDGELERRERKPNFVKIDIEGAEVFALRGAKNLMTLSDARPLVLLAVHPMFLPEFGCDAKELSQMIAERNYTAFDTTGAIAEYRDRFQVKGI